MDMIFYTQVVDNVCLLIYNNIILFKKIHYYMKYIYFIDNK